MKFRQTSLPASTSEPRTQDPMQSKGFVTGSRLAQSPTPQQIAPLQTVLAPPLNLYTSSYPVGIGTEVVIGHNANRRYLMLQNNAAIDIWVAWGAQAVIGRTVRMPPNATWTWDGGYCPINSLAAVSSAIAFLTITEGTLTGVR